MSVLAYIESRVIDAELKGIDLQEITLDRDMYRKFIAEITPLMRQGNNYGSFNQRLSYNSALGPITINCGPRERIDPNDLLKEIL